MKRGEKMKKINRLRDQIIWAFVFMGIISIVFMGSISLLLGRDAIKRETLEKTAYMVASEKNAFEKEFVEANKIIKVIEGEIFRNIEIDRVDDFSYLDKELEKLAPVIEKQARYNSWAKTAYFYLNPMLHMKVSDVYYADENGDGEVERQENIPIEYFTTDTDNISKEWWFGAVEQKKYFWSKPYEWKLDNDNTKTFISYTKAVYNKDVLLGVAGTDMDYDLINNRIKNIKLLKTGYAFLLDEEYKPIVFEEKEKYNNVNLVDFNYENTPVDGIFSLSYKRDNIKKIVVFTKLSSGWFFGVEFSESEIYSNLNKYMILMIVILTSFVLIMIIYSIFIANRVSKPLFLLSNHIEKKKHSDKKSKFPQELKSREDEVGQLTNVLEETFDALWNSMENIESKNKDLTREINLRINAENQLERMSELIANSEDAIFIADEYFNIEYTNEAFHAITGYDRNSEKLNLDEYGFEISVDMKELLLYEKSWTGEFKLKNSSGNNYIIKLFLSYITQEKSYYLGIFKDLTHIKQKETDVLILKRFDEITKLPNRNHFQNLVQKSISNENLDNAFYILFNIENIRLINSVMGVEFGTKVLKEISKTLINMIGGRGIFGRTNGDEFGVWMPIETEEEKFLRNGRLDELLKHPININGENIYLNINVGASMYPRDDKNSYGLMQKASTALNEATKNERKNIVFFDQSVEINMKEQYDILRDLRFAVDREELELYYQPQVDVLENKINGIEALLRWKKDGKIIYPGQFIDIAESSNLIISIGEWVLNDAIKYGKKLMDKGNLLTLGVNVSVKQLYSVGFLEKLKKCLILNSYPAEYLELEITESSFLEDTKRAHKLFREIRGMGVKIAIDDFGMGYSSLAYLKHFTFDRLKIDRAFIKDIPDNDDGKLSLFVMELGKQLGVEVIAEGIETVEQKKFLFNEGCRYMQGYLFGKPMTKQNLENLISNGKNI